MKKIKYVENDVALVGKVIEYTESLGLCIREYGKNPFGNYAVLNTQLLPVSEKKILRQKTLSARLNRLFVYFKDAGFISESAIDHLNQKHEDITTLSDMITF